jgi:hypothetical protein
MRRALPWLTVGLLILGLGAGTGLGIAGQTSTPRTLTASRQISRIVVATRRAQTARITYSDSTASPNRLLRRSDRGSGEIDFGRHTMHTVERDRSTGFSGTGAQTARAVAQDNVTDDVWIGRTEYTRIDQVNNLDLDPPWSKGATWSKNSFGPLGALGQIGPLGELALDESVPGFRVEDAGSGMVRGVRTTRYRIVVPLCGTAAAQDGITQSMQPLQLWVDGQGRLVQARLSNTEDITKAAYLRDQLAGEGELTGRLTTISAIDLGDFGAHVAITAPRVRNTQGSDSFGFIGLKRGPCR